MSSLARPRTIGHFYLRDGRTSVIGRHSEIIAIRQAGPVEVIRGDVGLVYEALRELRHPRQASEVAAALKVSKKEAQRLLAVLGKAGLAIRGTMAELEFPNAPGVRGKSRPLCRTLVVGLCGAIQSAVSIGTIHSLKGIVADDIHVVLTESALEMVKPRVVQYFGLNVWTDEFAATPGVNVPHIWLAAQADLVLVLPASAHTICKLATGACSDLLSLTVAATRAPVVVAPVMNSAMFGYPATMRNLRQLRNDGIYVLEPGIGFEVSGTSDGKVAFMGVGATQENLVRALAAVLQSSGSGGPR